MIKLWSHRPDKAFANAGPSKWVLERECMISTANEWLEVFRKSEPDVKFVLSDKKPK